MEGFTYHNIFETKGIEYIIILGFFAILIPFWIILNRRVELRKTLRKLLSPSLLKIPQGVYFSRNHTWCYLERSGNARIGLDDLLVHITGKVHLVNIPEIGTHINKGDLLAVVEHEGKKLTILSPLSGEIITRNPRLKKEPQLLYEDPIRDGWICKIRPINWISETQHYYLAEKATEWTHAELVKIKDFIVSSANRGTGMESQVILQDGGEIRENSLSEMPEEVWHSFQSRFLNNLS